MLRAGYGGSIIEFPSRESLLFPGMAISGSGGFSGSAPHFPPHIPALS